MNFSFFFFCLCVGGGGGGDLISENYPEISLDDEVWLADCFGVFRNFSPNCEKL